MIAIRFFGKVATLAGRVRLEMNYQEGMSLQNAYEQLQLLYPEAFASVAIAVVNGMQFRDMLVPLDDGCEVVFMPKLFSL